MRKSLSGNKIIIVENSLYVTGAFNAILNVSLGLKDTFDFIYIIPKESETKQVLLDLNYTVFEIPFLEINKSWKLILYLPVLILNSIKVLRIANRTGVQLIHVNDIYNLVGCCLKLFKPSVKIVYHVRLLKDSYIKSIYPFLAKIVTTFSDKIISVSEAVKSGFDRKEKITAVYDIVPNVEKYEPWKGLKDNKSLKILYLGNYTPGKGQFYGLKAFKLFQAEYPNSSISFVGAATSAKLQKYKESLIDYSATNGLENKVFFFDTTSDVEKCMKNHDVVLNLSESESFSLVCLEALKFGIPLITSNSGGPFEITEGGKRALLIDNKNSVEAFKALSKIASDVDHYINLSTVSKKWALEKFAPKHSLSMISDLYSDLLKK